MSSKQLTTTTQLVDAVKYRKASSSSLQISPVLLSEGHQSTDEQPSSATTNRKPSRNTESSILVSQQLQLEIAPSEPHNVRPKSSSNEKQQMVETIDDIKPFDTQVQKCNEIAKEGKPTADKSAEELLAWVSTEVSDWRVKQLKMLMRYIIDLLDGTPAHASEAVTNGLHRVSARIGSDFGEWPKISTMVLLGYTTCFKTLLYLGLYNINFDADLVLRMVKWQMAYREISYIYLSYQEQFNREIHSEVHALCVRSPNSINNSLARRILSDLKRVAHQSGHWSRSSRLKGSNYYGSHLQNTDTILAAKQFATNTDVSWADLDNREPNTPFDTEQEFITLVMSAVAAVDKAFQIKRNPSEWEDLRESLTAFGVCDNEGDLYTEFSMAGFGNRTGFLQFYPYDFLTPIGCQKLIFCAPESALEGSLKSHENKTTESIKHIDPYTIRIRYEDGSETVLAFIGDVSFARIPEGVKSVSSVTDGIIFQYHNTSLVEERDYRRLGDITMAMTRKIISNSQGKPCPTPKGIASIAFCLTRPWKTWRGVCIADGPVSLVAMNSLKEKMESMNLPSSSRPASVEADSTWDGYNMDLEVFGIARRGEHQPASFTLLAYLAHLCTHPAFNWPHISATVPFKLGDPNTVVLLSDWDVDRLIEFGKHQCDARLPEKRNVQQSSGLILVDCKRPWDVIIVFISLFLLCLLPSIFSNFDRWTSRLSNGLECLGTVFVPVFALYLFCMHRTWNVRDMVRGLRLCDTLELAERVSGRPKEETALLCKKQGVARHFFHSFSNSIALSGQQGFGYTMCIGGLNAQQLMKLGVIFLASFDTYRPVGMIDVHGYLALEKDSELDVWRAKKGRLEKGVYRTLTEEEVEHLFIR